MIQKIISYRINSKIFFLIVILFIVVAFRVIFSFKTFTLSPDISTQLHTLVNFSQGKGITVNVFDNGRIMPVRYAAHAPGLIFFLNLFYFFFKDVILSSCLLNLASDLSIILFAVLVAKELELPFFQKLFLYLILGIIVSPFYASWTADYLATAFVVWATFFLFKYAKHLRLPYISIASILCALSYFVKYSFLPFLFLPFLFILLKQLIERRYILRHLIYSLSVIFVLFFLTVLVNYYLIGKPAQTVETVYGFYPENLKKFDAFLFHFGTYDLKLNSLLTKLTRGLIDLRRCTGLATCIAIAYFLFRVHKYYRAKTVNGSFNFLILLFTSLTFLIVPFLTFLSLISAPIKFDANWTYVETTRYFAPVIILFNFLFVLSFLNYKHKLLGYVMLILFTGLHVLAYRSFYKIGMYGNDYFSVRRLEKKILNTVPFTDSAKPKIILYGGKEKFCNTYYILNANAIVTSDTSVTKINREDSLFQFIDLANFNNLNQ